MKQFSALPVALSMALLVAACGDEEGDDNDGAGGSGNNGTAGGAGTLNLNTGGGAGSMGSAGMNGDPMQDGGVVDLTDDQVDDLNGASCAGWSAEPETQPAVLQLVVDTSLSMDEPPDGGGRGRNNDPTKWDITRDALQEVLGTLPEELAIGLFFYPNMETEGSDEPRPVAECVNLDEGIGVAPLTDQHRENLIEIFDDTEPNGWTPTHGAYEHALET